MAGGGPGAGLEYKDYYAVLGVPRTASKAEIKKAFRKAARESHPDAKPGDKAAEQRFKDVSEANEVLSDPEKRKRYDTLGAAWDQSRPAAARRRPVRPGRAVRRVRPRWRLGRAGGVRYEFRTTRRRRRVQRLLPDVLRRGRRRRATSPAVPVPAAAAARPAASPSNRSSPGWASTASAAARAAPRAPTARPSRRPRPSPRSRLEEAYHGTTRRVDVEGKHLEVTIPKGADTGTRVRLSGKAPGGGDLFVVVRLEPHKTFKRRGADLERELPLTLGEALLGGEVPVRTLKGKVLLTVPGGHPAGPDLPPRRPGDAAARRHRPRRPLRPREGGPPDRPRRRGPGGRHDHHPAHRPTRPPLPRDLTCNSIASPRRPRRPSSRPRPPPPGCRARSSTPSTSSARSSSPTTASRPRRSGGSAWTCPRSAARSRRRSRKRARVEGGSLSLDPRAKTVIERAEAEARRLGDDYVSTEHLLLGVAEVGRRGPGPARAPRGRQGGHPPGAPERPRRPARHLAEPGEHLRGPREVRPRPDRRGPGGQARPGHRPRRRGPPGHPGPVAPDQEQPGAHRRARRRQDRHRRGPGPADRPRRRPRGAQGQARRRRSTSARSSPGPSSAASSRSG